MHKEFTVSVHEKSYQVYITRGKITGLGRLIKEQIPRVWKSFIISDETVDHLYGDLVFQILAEAGLQPAKAVIPAGEQSKSLETVSDLYSRLSEHGVNRNSAVIALGGGMIGDLAGFVAASYMRGLPLVQVPTTLLSEADSSLGGKVAVNHAQGKNMIGFFYHPELVFTDIDFLKTLPQVEINAGIAEIIRHGMILDADFFSWIEKNAQAIRQFVPDVMVELIYRSCQIKKGVIEQDEREAGYRSILNFGHTIGHALETVTGYQRYRHGEAVAIGMVQICRLAEKLGWLAHEDVQRVSNLLQQFALPVDLPVDVSSESLMEVMQRDKKSFQGKIKLIVPRGIGQVQIVHDWREEDLLAILNSAYEK